MRSNSKGMLELLLRQVLKIFLGLDTVEAEK
jgi:hypothetical protein